MIEQNKIQKLLEIMVFLSSGIKYTLEEIAERFEMSERTTRRYIQTFREAGFIIPKPENGRYYIDKESAYFKEISELIHFSKEEAIILQKAIHSVSDENPLKQNLVKKLYALYDFERVADTIVKEKYSVNIHQLMQAIKCKNKVILRDYLSANSKQQKDRIVEPFDFTNNYIAIWAYDIEDGCCKTFKNTRIASVQILPEPWEHKGNHIKLPMDIFRIGSKEKTDIKLQLSIRAAELLQEEYPLSEQYITQINKEQFDFEAPVSGFDGVGRFIMGLCEEIKIIYPESLKDFLKNKAEKILTVRS
ncbi:helix-turn-helix transcriptional regulator [Ancylomarina longa]|uniref:WYL domain-containing protein n=1 Tax=Ancylomarina longa TaxID=2487017 RepID=A0A434ATP2_9BACT|nr:WYL domain-containing protein [Ancylomarina longa]RUT77774.1 WYL domain-containing protein [Ancylomarina longa]